MTQFIVQLLVAPAESQSYQAGGGLKALIFDISGKTEKKSGIKLLINLKINPKNE